MQIYQKYIAKNILYPLLAITFILTSLIWITRILKLLPLIDQGIGFTNFIELAILFLPSIIFMLSPLIVVVAIIYVYIKLQNDRQLTILKISGLTNYAIAKPALFIAIVITIISYYISFHLLPLSYSKLKNSLNSFRENYVSRIITEKTFNQLSKYITIYVDRKDSDGALVGIILFDNKSLKKNSILFAKKGNIIVNNGVPLLHLQDGFRQAFDENNNPTNLYFKELLVEIGSDNSNKNDRNKTSLELYINEMLWPDENLPRGKKLRRVMDAHQRLIWPFFNYALTFLAISIFLNISYTRKPKVIDMVYVFAPLLIVTYFHFSLQRIAYQAPIYIIGCYLNLFFCLIFSICQSYRNKI